MVQDSVPEERTDDPSENDSVEQRLTALEEQNKELKAALHQQESGLPNVTRRQALGGLLGGGALLGAAGSASAQPPSEADGPPFADEDHDHSGDYLGQGVPVERIDVGDLNTESLTGITFLHSGLNEAEVREKIATASKQEGFIIEPGAQWILRDTLKIQAGTSIYGYDIAQNPTAHYTFKKGFDGTLATVQNFVALRGVLFDGNKENYSGDGVVDENATGAGVLENRWLQCSIRQCAGDGRVIAKSYFNHYDRCRFMQNDGYGIRSVPAAPSHNSQNLYTRCSMSRNGRAGVGIFDYDHTTVYLNCSLVNNSGPGFYHHDGEEVHGFTQNLLIQGCNVNRNGGPAWLHQGGFSTSLVFANCIMPANAQNPSSDLTTPDGVPVGNFHVEDGQLGLEIRGGYVVSQNQLYTASEKTSEHDLVISGSGKNSMEGNINGRNTLLTVENTDILDGSVSVQSGVGLDPKDGVVRY